jgi:hypothetical protein
MSPNLDGQSKFWPQTEGPGATVSCVRAVPKHIFKPSQRLNISFGSWQTQSCTVASTLPDLSLSVCRNLLLSSQTLKRERNEKMDYWRQLNQTLASERKFGLRKPTENISRHSPRSRERKLSGGTT